MTYYPDKWVMLKITHPVHGITHKILASWYGGFGGTNSWKLSSGNTYKVILDGGVIKFPQSSGSTYVVARENYGMSAYTMGILQTWIDQLALDPNQGTIELLDQNFDIASTLSK